MAFAPEEYDINTNWGIMVLEYMGSFMNTFFMHLFFFYFGYFYPMSLDKRGMYIFLFERVKQLGIPFAVFGFFLIPYAQLGTYLFSGTYNLPTGVFDQGVAWFLSQLLEFSIAYTYICGGKWSPKIKCPSNLALFGISFVLGFLAAGTTTLFFPSFDQGPSVLLVLTFWASYWGYIVYFLWWSFSST
jgi:hypothetical protein